MNKKTTFDFGNKKSCINGLTAADTHRQTERAYNCCIIWEHLVSSAVYVCHHRTVDGWSVCNYIKHIPCQHQLETYVNEILACFDQLQPTDWQSCELHRTSAATQTNNNDSNQSTALCTSSITFSKVLYANKCRYSTYSYVSNNAFLDIFLNFFIILS